MDTNNTYDVTKYNRAKARVAEIKSFYNHAIVYVLVNVGFASLNFYQNGWQTIWFIWPLAGWGIGLASHGIATFNMNPFLSKDWEERKMKEILEKND